MSRAVAARAATLSLALALITAAHAAHANEPGPVQVPAHGAMPLPAVSFSAEEQPYESFMGSPSVSVEAVALYGVGDASFRFRPTAILRLGPLVVGVGAVISKETQFNAHLEFFSFQSSGWEVAFGAGLADGATIRIAIPFIEGFRVRLMTAYDSTGFVAGLGLEAAPW